MTFSEEVADLGLTKDQLAERMGVFPSTVTVWGEDPPPYCVAYLKILRANKILLAEISEGLKALEKIVSRQADLRRKLCQNQKSSKI